MKKIVDYIGLFCWAGILLINLVAIVRGQQISQLTIMLATVYCLLYSIEQVIRDGKQSAEKSDDIPSATEQD